MENRIQARQERKGEGPALATDHDVARQPAKVARHDRPGEADSEQCGPEGEEDCPPWGLYWIGHPCDYLQVLPGSRAVLVGDEP